MKSLLKYILLVTVAIAFFNGAAGRQSCDGNIHAGDAHEHEDVLQTSLSSRQTTLCVPPQIYSANSLRLQSNSRRSGNFHRHGFECIKSGKATHSGITYTVQAKSFIFHSSFIEPSRRIVTLCRFII